MIERYSRPEMAAIWTEQNKFEAYLKVEILACEAWAHLGHIPMEDVEKLWKNASFDLNRIYEIEQEKQRDAIASDRKAQVGTGDRSERIRTYNYPQGRLSDHRIGLTLYKLEQIVSGDLDEVIDSLITFFTAEKLKNQNS